MDESEKNGAGRGQGPSSASPGDGEVKRTGTPRANRDDIQATNPFKDIKLSKSNRKKSLYVEKTKNSSNGSKDDHADIGIGLKTATMVTAVDPTDKKAAQKTGRFGRGNSHVIHDMSA